MHRMNKKIVVVFTFVMVALFAQSAFAQLGLNWEGQTGAHLTPFAYTVGAPDNKLGKPEIALHFLAGGPALGEQFTLSATEGFGKRFEAGFTTTFAVQGSNSSGAWVGLGGTSPDAPGALFSSSYTTLHGKYTLVKENAYKTKWVPAIAVGAVGRFGDSRVIGAVLPGVTSQAAGISSTNGDFYVVATKLVPVKKVIVLLNVGEKVTNASLWGLAGNAGNVGYDSTNAPLGQSYHGNWFATAGLAFAGPAKSLLVVGAEAVQQPHYIQAVNNVIQDYNNVPTSSSYFLRVQPKGKPFNVDVALVKVAGGLSHELNVQATSRFGTGITYRF